MSAKVQASNPAMKQAVLNMLLEQKRSNGAVSNRTVRDAATVLGCSMRTLRRWLVSEAVAEDDRAHWQPTAEQHAEMLRLGSVSAFHRKMRAQDPSFPSRATVYRGFQLHTATVERLWARAGMQAARGMLPTTPLPDVLINDEWAMDDTLLPIWCVLPDGTIGKAWMQTIIDTASRFVLAWTVAPAPFTSEDAVETLAKAVAGHHIDDDVFVGGKPHALRTDRGANFTAAAMSVGLVAASVDRRFSEAYTPEQNGKIERWHRTIKSLFRGITGFDMTDWKRGDPRKAALPPSADEVLLYEEVLAEVQGRIRAYNHELIHSAHNNTPAQFWAESVRMFPDQVQPADPVALRAAMQQRETRTLRRRRLRWEGNDYALHPHSAMGEDDASDETIARRAQRIAAMEGNEVEIRYLHGRVEYLSVYTPHGEYLGDAVLEQIQTPEQVAETVAARRQHLRTMNTSLKEVAKQNAEAVARRREEALAAADPGSETFGPAAKAKPKKRKAAGSRMSQRREAAEQQRRDDIANAAEAWDFGDTA